MHADGRPVTGRAGDGNLELARQKREFGVECRPLAQDLADDPGILNLVRRTPAK